MFFLILWEQRTRAALLLWRQPLRVFSLLTLMLVFPGEQFRSWNQFFRGGRRLVDQRAEERQVGRALAFIHVYFSTSAQALTPMRHPRVPAPTLTPPRCSGHYRLDWRWGPGPVGAQVRGVSRCVGGAKIWPKVVCSYQKDWNCNMKSATVSKWSEITDV